MSPYHTFNQFGGEGLRVTCLKWVGSCWLLAFTGSPDAFDDMRQILRDLPAHTRKWDPDDRCWRITNIGMSLLLRICPFLADAEGRQESYKQRTSAPQPRQAACTTCEAYGALYLIPSAPDAVVKAVYRALAQQHHPDHGGDHTTMKRINSAHELILTHTHAQGCNAFAQGA